MQGFELTEIIEKFPSIKNNFDGNFSIDTIPKFIKKQHFFFCNEDLLKNPGTHWICFLKEDKNTLECFDSLGFSQDKQLKFKTYFKFKNVKQIKFNETCFQSYESITCGLFVLYFAINRMHNLDLSYYDFLNEYFTTNILKNELLVKEFFKT